MTNTVDIGSSSFSHTNLSIPIPTVSAGLMVSTAGALLIAEFGLGVESPLVPHINNFNMIQLFGTIGVKSGLYVPSKLRILVTQTNMSLLGAPEEIIFIGEENLSEIFIDIQNSNSKLISFNTSIGGSDNIVFHGYHRYRLYIVRVGELVNPGSEPIVTGPIEFQGVSYVKSA